MTRRSCASIVGGILLLSAIGAPGCEPPHAIAMRTFLRGTSVLPLAVARRAPHAYGRAGDLVLQDASGASLTFAKTADAAGHRALHGALVDALVGPADRQDSLLWWRAAWFGNGHLHISTTAQVEPMRCNEGTAGVRLEDVVDGVTLHTEVCASALGVFTATTTARDLPENARLADELNGSTAEALFDGGGAWEGQVSTSFVALSEAGIALSLEAPGMTATRGQVHIAAEAFPAPTQLFYEGASVTRTFRVHEGDGFTALAGLKTATRAVSVGLRGEETAWASILSANEQLAVRGEVSGVRDLLLPPTFGATLALADSQGVPAGAIGLDALAAMHTWTPPRAARSTLALDFAEPETPDAPLPVHVLFRGLDGTPDPRPLASATHSSFTAGRSLYLVDGRADVALPPGRYRIVATHGITHGISVTEVTLAAGETKRIDGILPRIVDMSGWTAGDFHLHAAPSPDAPVPLDARIASVASEGIELAVATDHNVITDYAPTVARLGLASRIVTVVGDEITSTNLKPTNSKWGHFNAYPLPAPAASVAPEDATPPYADVLPSTIFAGATEAGARFVQINHPRMDPQIGYFDLTHFDAATGKADAAFSDAFELVEAFNGVWIELPDRTRQGAHDAIGLVRRGHRPVIMGNSDSHKLLFEEPGYPRTFVHTSAEPIATRASRVMDTLQLGDTTVSSGPIVDMTVDGKPVGSVLSPRAGTAAVTVHVRVRAPAWVPVEHVEIWIGDAVAKKFAVGPAKDGVRFESDVVLPVTADTTILAWADADTPLPDVLPYANARAIGFTGLVYVDANGDGRIDLAPRAAVVTPSLVAAPPK